MQAVQCPPSKVHFTFDRSHPYFICLQGMHFKQKVRILKTVTLMLAEIHRKRYFVLQVNLPSLTSYRRNIYSRYSARVKCFRRQVPQISFQRQTKNKREGTSLNGTCPSLLSDPNQTRTFCSICPEGARNSYRKIPPMKADIRNNSKFPK